LDGFFFFEKIKRQYKNELKILKKKINRENIAKEKRVPSFILKAEII
jgi:hypothetical protein